MKRTFDSSIKLRAETSTQEEILTVRSSCWQIFIKISVLKNSIHRKIPVLESYFKKVAGIEDRNRKIQHRCFPVNIAKFLTTAFSIEQLWWMLLELRYFFSLWYRTLKFMKIVWRKHNLMIFFSVGSGHPGKFHMRSPWILMRVRKPLGEN